MKLCTRCKTNPLAPYQQKYCSECKKAAYAEHHARWKYTAAAKAVGSARKKPGAEEHERASSKDWQAHNPYPVGGPSFLPWRQ